MNQALILDWIGKLSYKEGLTIVIDWMDHSPAYFAGLFATSGFEFR